MLKILIIKPSSFGDIIHGLQWTQSLRHYFPNAHIDWVVRDIFSPLVQACNTVDTIHIFKRHGSYLDFLRLVTTIRNHRYDYVFDLQGLARSALITFFSGAKYRFGRTDCRELASIAYSRQAPLPKNYPQSHAIDILLEFFPLIGYPPKLVSNLALKSHPLSHTIPHLTKKPIILFPNSRRPEKEWPYFPDLTQKLIHDYPEIPILWLGQQPISHHIQHPYFFNLINKTSISDMIGLIQQSQLCITNDSGPMHLAAAMQKPILALFGPTEPTNYGPYPLNNPQHTILKAPNKNLSELSADTVYLAIKKIMATS